MLCEPLYYHEGLHPPCRIFTGNIIALDIEKSMEFLFATNLNINDSDGVYKVYFDHEKYMFQPDTNDNSLPAFSFKREHDEWHNQEPLTSQIKKQAINVLEKYLLAQH